MYESLYGWGRVSDPALFLSREGAARWTPEDKELLRKLFLIDQMPIASIAQALGRTPASTNTALSLCGIPRQRSVPKLTLPTEMSVELARIHAHICGDGNLHHWKEKDDYGYLKEYKRGRYRNRWAIVYTNTNPKLIQSFIEDARKLFGIKPYWGSRKYETRVKSKAVWHLLKSLGAGGSREWRIPSVITESRAEIKAAWLHAFFDDEAHFVPNAGIRVRSVNRPGLEQAAQMLRQFVPCHLTPRVGLYPDESCYLAVLKSDRERFLEVVGSTKYPG